MMSGRGIREAGDVRAAAPRDDGNSVYPAAAPGRTAWPTAIDVVIALVAFAVHLFLADDYHGPIVRSVRGYRQLSSPS